MIARGILLGPDQPVILHMLDIPPAAEALNGVKMELIDAAFPLLKGSFLPPEIQYSFQSLHLSIFLKMFVCPNFFFFFLKECYIS